MISSSITEACNNSILLLGPRGSGKSAVCGKISWHKFYGGFVHVDLYFIVTSPLLLFLLTGFGACYRRFAGGISRHDFSGRAEFCFHYFGMSVGTKLNVLFLK